MPFFPQSTALSFAEYDPVQRTLHIKFRHGFKTYTYYGIPAQIYEGLIRASSKGRYYDAHIKDRYSFNQY